MNTKLVYALVSNQNDFYTEQFYVSAITAKRNNVNHIVLVVDNRTEKYLRDFCAPVLDVVDEFVSIPFPDDLNNKLRSRYLKTTIRNLVNGDMLFIDTDTIITESLDDIDLTKSEMAAVYDMHVPLKEHASYKGILYKAGRIGYQPLEDDEYFNSGVMYIKDSKATRAFFDEWHENYLNGVKVGNTTDQQSLLQTNSKYKLIDKLDDVWNCQIICNVRDLNRARIIHYYCSGVHKGNNTPVYKFMSIDICKQIRVNSFCLTPEIENLLLSPKSSFNNPVKILAGADLVLNSSLQYYLLSQFFFKYPKIYSKIEAIIQLIRKNIRRK